ncbi:MAG: phenylalanine--tRNA ligase subunit alpha [Candidatus Thorarchaeota archaeon]
MKYRISEKARQILNHLRKTAGPLSPSSIAKSLAFRDETVRSLLENLRQRKFIEDYETSVQKYYKLTPEGQHFAENGLPEIRLVRVLAEQGGEASVSTLANSRLLKRTEQQLALGWARRNGWISVIKRDGDTWMKLQANAEVAISQHPLQLALNAAARTGQLQKNQLDFKPNVWKAVQLDLEKRTLAEPVAQQVVTVIITPEGNRALDWSLSEQDLIRDLSPDILKSGQWAGREFLPYNLRAPTSPISAGKKHPYVEFIDRVKRILIGLGFQEAKGPLVELEFWNSDALFMPQDHVAREVHDLYHIKTPTGPGTFSNEAIVKRVAKTHENGWKTGSKGWDYSYNFDIARRLVLRSQTTAVSVRYLSTHQKAPLRMFSIDRNFRPEKFDATHSAEFLQCEGIIGGEGLTLRDLMGYLRAIAEGVGIEKIKFKPGFFPFTEPSVEGFIYIPEIGWKEALPGGIFRPEVTLPLGIDFPVLAWGIGIDRLAMAALKINDIRELATRDLGWLRRTSMRF